MSIYSVGLSTTGHDPAFAIVSPDGEVVFAEATERFLQSKRAWGAQPDQLSHVKPVLGEIIRNDPSAEFQISLSWSGKKNDIPVAKESPFIATDMLEWMVAFQANLQQISGANIRFIGGKQVRPEVFKFDHHLCHAANAAYSSNFSEACCFVLDGEGEVGAATLFRWKEGFLKRKWRSWGPGSLGSFYTWATEICGFTSQYGEEWKVMGLAAYGEVNHEWAAKLCTLFRVEEGRVLWNELSQIKGVVNFFNKIKQQDSSNYMEMADFAATVQHVYCKYATDILNDIYVQENIDNLILSGGCALNSSFNGQITSSTPFKSIHVPSAPADDGNAIGAALLGWQKTWQNESGTLKPLKYGRASPFLGSKPDVKNVDSYVQALDYKVEHCSIQSASKVAELLSQGKIVGVMRRRAEFGPRALGNRSILADPRCSEMKATINKVVKGREGYRPFAPVIPEKYLSEWFENPQLSPYMSFALKWKPHAKTKVPAVVHNDVTGRLQTINRHENSWLNALIEEFYSLTGVPIVLNTSFNVMGKPIVHSVSDAILVLISSGLDAVLIEDTLILKR